MSHRPASHTRPAPVAIVAAMHEELHELLAGVETPECHRIGNREFWQGQLLGQPVVLVQSRVGKVAAAATTAALLMHFPVRAVLLTGVAGGLAPSVSVGDVVVASHLLQHDMDASPLFPRFEVPLTGVSRFAADAPLAKALNHAAQAVMARPAELLGETAMQAFGLTQPRVHQGLIVSGDRFVATAQDSHALREALPDALAVEMEGAAMAQVCHEWGVPFVALRAISDRADDSAHVDFPRFVNDVGARYSAGIVRAWLSTLTA